MGECSTPAGPRHAHAPALKDDIGQGEAGVAWGLRILPVKVLNASNSGNEVDLAQGIVYTAGYGADILSKNLGGYDNLQALYDAARYSPNLDCTIFAAHGNDNSRSIDYSSAFQGIELRNRYRSHGARNADSCCRS